MNETEWPEIIDKFSKIITEIYENSVYTDNDELKALLWDRIRDLELVEEDLKLWFLQNK